MAKKAASRKNGRSDSARADGLSVLGCASAAAWGRWLGREHARSRGVWLKIPKKAGGRSGPSYQDALVEALRFGWIDGQKDKLDADFFLQRFTPRGPRSRWSKRNRDQAQALLASGRMEAAGRAQVEAAQADGRWAAAYDSHRTAEMPSDLAAALAAVPSAKAFFAALNAQNRYAILHRVQAAKLPETRARRIARFVDMCARGETLH